MVQKSFAGVIAGVKAIPDLWLSEVLRRPAYFVNGPSDRGKTPAVLRRGFFYTKVEATDVPGLRAMIKRGFCLVDVAVTMERSPAREGGRSPRTVRAFVASDAPALRSWMSRAFRFSRFHLDPHFSVKDADRIKRAWMENMMGGRRGDGLWVALHRGRAVAFLGALKRVEHGRTVAVLDLMGVHPAYRGRGFGTDLVEKFINENTRAKVLRVGTQSVNLPSIRLYQKCGFKPVKTQFVLHAHGGPR
jgi:GNAT superfamily N-acetyltransferase